MGALCLAALLVLGQESGGKAVFNSTSLTDRDWSNERYAVSLDPGERWNDGTAWFFRYSDRVAAWKGKYEFYTSDDKEADVTMLRIGFQRQYDNVKEGAKWKWVLNTRYEPQGMDIEIPLKSSRVPDHVIQLSVMSGFWAGPKGGPITRTQKSDGAFGRLLGLEKEVELYSLDHVDLGDTLELTDTPHRNYLDLIVDSPPPGFKPRTRVATSATLAGKPVITASMNIPSIEDIHRLFEKQDLRGAFAAADQRVKIEPMNAQARYLRGSANRRLKKDSDAVADFDVAISIAPDRGGYYAERGQAYKSLGKFLLAVQDYRKYLQLKPNDAAAFNMVAWQLAVGRGFSDKDAAAALDYARVAGKLTNYKNWMYVDTLAAAYARRKDFGPAIRAQAEAIRLAPVENKDELTARLRLYEAGKSYFE